MNVKHCANISRHRLAFPATSGSPQHHDRGLQIVLLFSLLRCFFRARSCSGTHRAASRHPPARHRAAHWRGDRNRSGRRTSRPLRTPVTSANDLAQPTQAAYSRPVAQMGHNPLRRCSSHVARQAGPTLSGKIVRPLCRPSSKQSKRRKQLAFLDYGTRPTWSGCDQPFSTVSV